MRPSSRAMCHVGYNSDPLSLVRPKILGDSVVLGVGYIA